MKLNDLIQIGDTVERLSEFTNTTIPDLVDALTGLAWNEEEAELLKEYHASEEGWGFLT